MRKVRRPRSTFKGRYIPKNPQKYMGNPNNIIFRSSWELLALKFFDTSTSVIRYASEEFGLQYLSPVDGKVHTYYPDFLVEYMHRDGTVHREIVEIKPAHEHPDLAPAPKTLDAAKTLAINAAKWKAAKIFAQSQGMEFRVLTEHDLFRNSKPPAKANKPTKPARRAKLTIQSKPAIRAKTTRSTKTPPAPHK